MQSETELCCYQAKAIFFPVHLSGTNILGLDLPLPPHDISLEWH